MRTLFLLSIYFLTIQVLYCQDVLSENKSGLRRVISTTGLNLRESPGISSEVVDRIPFGAIISISDENILIDDTLGTYEISVSDAEIITRDLIGHWIKVNYKGMNGYAFDAFLYEIYPELIEQAPKHPQLNKEYILQFPWCSCFDNFHFIPEMHWFGIFQLADGAVKAKEVQLRYFIDRTDRMFPLCISADERRNLLFIIGAKDGLHLEQISGAFNHLENEDDFNPDDAFHSEFEYNKNNGQLTLIREGKRQILNPAEELGNFAVVIWKGDLDSDTKTDYIIQFGIKGSETFLFLSGEVGVNQIVKPVAVYYNGYCC
ncbi:MAG TPA: SH3 domain-containing protein [Saprospiraceae bacterium]|nr:SH3 domain-containing protein [Saprospiraceae bacterium]